MTKLARRILKFALTVLFIWLTVMLCCTSVNIIAPLMRNPNVLSALTTFAAGLVIFSCWKMKSAYIFGHEATHWLTAKLFLRNTGKMKLSRNKGFVEVENSNVWITLAPYFVPFYTVLSIAGLGISQIFRYPSGQTEILIFACAAGLTYSFHAVMTVYALRLAQSDLEAYGKFFSLSLIAAGNSAFILLSILTAGGQWKNAADFFISSCITQRDICFKLAELVK